MRVSDDLPRPRAARAEVCDACSAPAASASTDLGEVARPEDAPVGATLARLRRVAKMIGDGGVVRDLIRREIRAAGADDLDAMASMKAKGVVRNDIGDTGDHEVLRSTSTDIEARAKLSRIPIEDAAR